MNSVIISLVAAFCRGFAAKFTKSKLWALIQNISGAVGRSWGRSRIALWLKSDCRSAKKSVFMRVILSPFTFLSWLGRRYGEAFSEKIEKSVICGACRAYVHNFMALNTRFWGVMLLCASVVFNALRAAAGAGLNKYVLAVSVIGALFIIPNMNCMRFFGTSKVTDLAKACVGVKNISFSFYNEKLTSGRMRIVCACIAGVITGAAMVISPMLGILVPFALFGVLLVLEYPITGVYAAVFAAPLIAFSSTPLAGLCMLTLISVILKSIYDVNFKWRTDGTGAALLLFLAVLLISSVLSFSPRTSLMVWLMYFIFIMFYFAIINTITTRAQIYGLLRLFVISGFAVAVYGIMQYAFGWTTSNAWIDEEMFEEETMRVYSTLGNPNVLGEYLLLVLPAAAAFFLKDKAKKLSKWVYLAITGIIFLCLILTQSRGCWLGFMVSTALFVTFHEGRWWAFLPLVLCILPFVIPETIVERLMSVGNMEDSSTSYRVYIWMGVFGMLRYYLAGGIGMGEGAFREVYPFFSYNAIVAPHSHNTYLQLLVEGGLPALISFIAVIVVFFKGAHSVYKMRNKKSCHSTMILALCAGVCGFLFQSLFDYTFYNYRVMAVFFMVIGMTMAFKYVSGQCRHEERSSVKQG